MALTFDEGGEWNRETEHGDPNRIGSQREREREREVGGSILNKMVTLFFTSNC